MIKKLCLKKHNVIITKIDSQNENFFDDVVKSVFVEQKRKNAFIYIDDNINITLF
jgi:hypothetical protein